MSVGSRNIVGGANPFTRFSLSLSLSLKTFHPRRKEWNNETFALLRSLIVYDSSYRVQVVQATVCAYSKNVENIQLRSGSKIQFGKDGPVLVFLHRK